MVSLFSLSSSSRSSPTEEPILPPAPVVAIDSEFVYTNSEVEGESLKSAERGANHTLARVSVILEVLISVMLFYFFKEFYSLDLFFCLLPSIQESPESVFLDDYIHVREPIVDYLTRFSGIKEGELTPGISPHPLSTSKKTYIKLVLFFSFFKKIDPF